MSLANKKIYPLKTYPDPILLKKSKDVVVFDNNLAILVDDMFASMYYHEGVGLAAVQIGILENIIVMDIAVGREENEPTFKICMINPVIIERSSENIILSEGCLSLPEERADIERSEKITVKYQDIYGNFLEIKAEGWLARCILHEIDHLIGIVFIDHLSNIKKRLAQTRLKKIALQHEKERKLTKTL